LEPDGFILRSDHLTAAKIAASNYLTTSESGFDGRALIGSTITLERFDAWQALEER
jgi:hypothetical protein